MALTPDDLGQVDVSITIDADGQLAARLAFDNPLAALDLRGRADELRRQLEEAGFRLSEDALQFSDRDPSSRRDGTFDQRSRQAFARSGRLAEDADVEISAPVAGRWMSLSLTPDRVDVKV
ncbi:flagellar hook-length control protein FliK [Rhizobium sp. CRIBSB]|nr:flagellar hook-length control protein FliK [Rhizobium sp. CRIBSB]